MGESFTQTIRRILAANPKRAIDDPALIPAGVMLIVYPKDGDYRVLLQKRSARVDVHKGEVSFPGGRMDAGDATLLDTALRETHEEMGVLPGDVEVLGALDDTATSTGYCTSPYVGAIPAAYEFNLSKAEVAEALEVPISSLLDAANRRDEMRIRDSDLESAPVFAYDGHIIFGATARILNRFLQLLESSHLEVSQLETSQ